jgi:hypothetical protein
MNRWNIQCIFFFGVNGQRRDVPLEPDAVNIITGASGTGKSALIKAIDYCLGSSKCELPAHVRRRSTAVGVKWVTDTNELVVGRIIPPVGQGTSTHMYATAGRNLNIPDHIEEFDGKATVDSAKAYIERVFGIGDLAGEMDSAGNTRERATVRHITPYLFVTKEVIYSESVLLHDLEKPETARDIVATMPYFLRVVDEASIIDERKLRRLQRVLEKDEALQRSRISADSVLNQRARSLLAEAYRIGMTSETSDDASEADLLEKLRDVSEGKLPAGTYPNDGELTSLHAGRREVLSRLDVAQRERKAAQAAIREASGFQTAVTRQHEKLELFEHLKLKEVADTCPVCASPSEQGRATAKLLQSTLSKVRAESAAVEKVRPKLIDYDRSLDELIATLNGELRSIDNRIRSWFRQSDETKRLDSLAQNQAHLMGRISYLLETSSDDRSEPARDLSVLRDEIAEIESRIDREARSIKLQRAERKISDWASDAFSQLPTVAPCVGSGLHFSSRQPEIRIIEAHTGAILRMPEVGSDQNYLAIHIALSFALQRYFGFVNAPVPGLLVLDQISRPYFPSKGEDRDEEVVDGREQSEDEDLKAMRQHINFLFEETTCQPGLQVLLIEHAYFADDPRYVAATRQRWTRASGDALIPLDWPVRADIPSV